MNAVSISHLWAKVHQILGQCTGPFSDEETFKETFSSLSIACSVLELLVLIRRRKSNTVLGPRFMGRNPKFRTSVFKSGLLLNTWHSLA